MFKETQKDVFGTVGHHFDNEKKKSSACDKSELFQKLKMLDDRCYHMAQTQLFVGHAVHDGKIEVLH